VVKIMQMLLRSNMQECTAAVIDIMDIQHHRSDVVADVISGLITKGATDLAAKLVDAVMEQGQPTALQRGLKELLRTRRVSTASSLIHAATR
jgi:hypothetical protein